jgi:hypothetical protein
VRIGREVLPGNHLDADLPAATLTTADMGKIAGITERSRHATCCVLFASVYCACSTGAAGT